MTETIAEPTLSQIFAELEIDPKKWESAGAYDQIMVVLNWGSRHDKRFSCSEMCKLLKLPEDVVLTILDGLMSGGKVLRFEVCKRG